MSLRPLLLACLALCCLPLPALAQEAWPARPIRLIVPFPPGAGTDTVARFVAQRLADTMKAQIVIESVASKLSSCTMTAGRGLPA